MIGYQVPLAFRYDTTFIPIKKLPDQCTAFIKGHGWNVFGSVYLRKEKPVIVFLKNPSLTTRLDTASVRKYLQTRFDRLKVKRIVVENDSLPFDTKSSKLVVMMLDRKSLSFDKKYEIDGEVKFVPEKVLVSGPRSKVAAVKDTLSITVPYRELNKNFDETFSLSYFLHDQQLIVSQDKIRVQFRVSKKSKDHEK